MTLSASACDGTTPPQRPGEKFEATLHRGFVTPWADGIEVPELLEVHQIQAFAQRQVAHGKSLGVRSFDGRPLLAELTRDTCYFKSLPLEGVN